MTRLQRLTLERYWNRNNGGKYDKINNELTKSFTKGVVIFRPRTLLHRWRMSRAYGTVRYEWFKRTLVSMLAQGSRREPRAFIHQEHKYILAAQNRIRLHWPVSITLYIVAVK
jgi:hypothetical protein